MAKEMTPEQLRDNVLLRLYAEGSVNPQAWIRKFEAEKVTTAEVAAMLGVKSETVLKMARQDRLPLPCGIGTLAFSTYFWFRSEIERYQREQGR